MLCAVQRIVNRLPSLLDHPIGLMNKALHRVFERQHLSFELFVVCFHLIIKRFPSLKQLCSFVDQRHRTADVKILQLADCLGSCIDKLIKGLLQCLQTFFNVFDRLLRFFFQI